MAVQLLAERFLGACTTAPAADGAAKHEAVSPSTARPRVYPPPALPPSSQTRWLRPASPDGTQPNGGKLAPARTPSADTPPAPQEKFHTAPSTPHVPGRRGLHFPPAKLAAGLRPPETEVTAVTALPVQKARISRTRLHRSFPPELTGNPFPHHRSISSTRSSTPQTWAGGRCTGLGVRNPQVITA